MITFLFIGYILIGLWQVTLYSIGRGEKNPNGVAVEALSFALAVVVSPLHLAIIGLLVPYYRGVDKRNELAATKAAKRKQYNLDDRR